MMSRREIAAALMLLLAAIGGVCAVAQTGERPPPTLDLSLPWSAQEFHTKDAARFAEAVHEATAGRVRIALHPGAVLGIKGPDSLRAARDGVVAMIDMAAFQQVGMEPILGLDALPFLVRDQAELRLLYAELRPAVEAALARHGLRLLYVVPWPPQNLYAKRRIETFADLRGLVIRTLDANTTELARRLGMTPVQLAAPDVVPALASGALDAVFTSTTTGAAQKYWEFLPYIHRTNHGWITNLVVINERALEALAPADRRALIDIAHSLEAEFWEVSRRDDLAKLALLEAHGMRTIVPDAVLMAAMQAVARPMWEDYAARVPQARAILDRFLVRTGRAPLGKAIPEAAS